MIYNNRDTYFIGTIDGYIKAYDEDLHQKWSVYLGKPLLEVKMDMRVNINKSEYYICGKEYYSRI
jgi:hypothetical protein